MAPALRPLWYGSWPRLLVWLGSEGFSSIKNLTTSTLGLHATAACSKFSPHCHHQCGTSTSSCGPSTSLHAKYLIQLIDRRRVFLIQTPNDLQRRVVAHSELEWHVPSQVSVPHRGGVLV